MFDVFAHFFLSLKFLELMLFRKLSLLILNTGLLQLLIHYRNKNGANIERKLKTAFEFSSFVL